MYNDFYVIDTHCHVYPEKIVDKAVGSTDKFYSTIAKCRGTVQSLLDENEKAGIDFSLIESVATAPKQVKSINEFIASSVKEHPDRFKGLGTIHPDSEDQEEDIKHIIELGLVGIKIHPDIQKFKIDDYRCLKVYELCEKYNLPILFHTGDNRYDYSNPNRLVPILEIYKDLKVIGAHFGGYTVWDEAVEKYKSFENFYIDVSSSLMYITKEKAMEYIDIYGVDRVLFGTDFPMWNPKEELDRFMSLPLSKNDKIKILSENAKRLYNI